MAAAMATRQLRISSISLLPQLSRTSLYSQMTSVYLRQLPIPLISSLRFALGLSLPSLPSIPTLLGDIWEGILKAVPKKKTSHSKKRHRQMAGKALKDQIALCKCPACGGLKRMHYLCTHCMQKIQQKLKDMGKEEEMGTKDTGSSAQ